MRRPDRRRTGDAGRRDRRRPDREVEPEGRVFGVRGELWPYRERALIVMHKPAGYECSQKPKHHPSVYSLLPAPLREPRRAGRSAASTKTPPACCCSPTTAQLIHRWTAPKHHLAKVYEVGCKHPVDRGQIEQLLAGVALLDAPRPVRAAACRHRSARPAPRP